MQSRPDIREVMFRLSLFSPSFQTMDLSNVHYTGEGNSSLLPCPFHEDDTSSFSVNAHGNVYICFGCGASGTSWDMIGHALFPGDYTWEKYHAEVIGWWKSNPQNANMIKPLPKKKVVEFNAQNVQRQIDDWHARLAFHEHNLSTLKSQFGIYDKAVIESFQLGYTGLDFKQGAYFSIPHYRSDGKLMGVQRRFAMRKVPDGTHRYWQIPGSKARMIFNGASLVKKSDAPVFFCEDEWSVIHFAQLGYDAISRSANLGDMAGLHESWIPLLERRKIIIVPDNDEVGIECADIRASLIKNSTISSIPGYDKNVVKDFADLCMFNVDIARDWINYSLEFAGEKNADTKITNG